MGNLRHRIFKSKLKLEQSLADELSSILEKEIQQHGAAKLLVSGGSTPIDLYSLLSKKDIKWSAVTIGLVDERFVSTDSKDSNEALIRKTLLQNNAKMANFVGMAYDSSDYEQNLDLAIAHNKDFNNSISCSILGMGSDGHTASLFPNKNTVYTDSSIYGNKTIMNTSATSEPINRISFTKDALLKSKHLFLYFNGENKLNVFQDAKENNEESLHPISAFINQEETLLNVFCSI